MRTLGPPPWVQMLPINHSDEQWSSLGGKFGATPTLMEKGWTLTTPVSCGCQDCPTLNQTQNWTLLVSIGCIVKPVEDTTTQPVMLKRKDVIISHGWVQAPLVSFWQYFPSQMCVVWSCSHTVNVVVGLDAFGCYVVIAFLETFTNLKVRFILVDIPAE